MAVALAGPYANNLHLDPDRQPHKHLIAQFLQAKCSSWRPTNSIKAPKAHKSINQGTNIDVAGEVLVPAVVAPAAEDVSWLHVAMYNAMQR